MITALTTHDFASWSTTLTAGRTRRPCTQRTGIGHASVAETLVEQLYASVRITDDTYRQLAEQIDRAYDERAATRGAELTDLAKHRAELETESDKLLRAHFADAIDLAMLKRHQDRIRASLTDIDRRLTQGRDLHATERSDLRMALELLIDCHHTSKKSSPDLRWIANAAFFDRIYLTEEGQPAPVATAAFADLIDTGEGSDKNTRVVLPDADEKKSSPSTITRKNTFGGP